MTAKENEDDVKLKMLSAEEKQDEDVDADSEKAISPSSEPSAAVENWTSMERDLFFEDGRRRIDYMLAWKTNKKPEEEEKAKKAREVFERNLAKEGLELEYVENQERNEVKFLKVHITWSVLSRYAEILKIRVPVKKNLVVDDLRKKYAKLENPMQAVSARLWYTLTGYMKKLLAPFQLSEEVMPPIKRKFTLPYSKDKEYLFEIPEDKSQVFDVSTRICIVNFILRRQPFSEDKQDAYSFGVNKMINDDIYTDAFPLHEGHWKPGSAENERKKLYDNWAYWKCVFKFQPLDHVRQYYGEKIAMYFTWLGFYTQMLMPASLVGLIVFFYGCAVSNDYPTKEICDPSTNITMCPLCDYQCPYWNLKESCSHAAASRIFDNSGTVFFSIFMAFWGTLFLEFWKRKQATYQFRWDLLDFKKEEQPPRPEYLARLAHCEDFKVHPITGMKEPHLPFWRKRFPVFLMSYGVILLLAFMAIGAVVGVIAYRVSVLAALQLMTKTDSVNTNSTLATTKAVIYQNASLVTTVTAACLNLLFIIVLNMIYTRIAFWLTDLECLRTQKEYDDSITIKLFALQFVNYYSSIVYIAFIKGRIVGRPGDYKRLFGGRQEECEAGGCLIELCIQLAIIMTGKQLIMNNVTEIVIPKFFKWVKKRLLKDDEEEKLHRCPWEKDHKLEPAMNTSLFYEYLEMILQFGFLTLFVAAFPLGPVFALLNNLLEIRFDAAKFTCRLRRPIPERAPDIGIWYQVLYGISRMAIISNAFIIALTSDFIPRLVYMQTHGTLEHYMNGTLAIFNTSDFAPGERPQYPGSDAVEICRYRDFRNPPGVVDLQKYEYSEMYWHILAARFAFVVVFENLIVVVTSLVAWMIPDIPHHLKTQMRREAYIANEVIIKTELVRARGEEVDDALEEIMNSEINRYQANNYGSMTLVERKNGSRSSKEEAV